MAKRKRNLFAKILRSRLFKPRVVQFKKLYNRKKYHKELHNG
jgi:hypothetical protein